MVDEGRRNNLVDMMRGAARQVFPPDRSVKDALIRESFEDTGGLKSEALSRALPPYQVIWYLSGTPSTATNVSSEIELPTAGTIRGIRVRCKTAPSGAGLNVAVRVNGSSVATASVLNGQTSGRSVGIAQAVNAGDVLTLDVISVNSAANVTVALEYVPVRV